MGDVSEIVEKEAPKFIGRAKLKGGVIKKAPIYEGAIWYKVKLGKEIINYFQGKKPQTNGFGYLPESANEIIFNYFSLKSAGEPSFNLGPRIPAPKKKTLEEWEKESLYQNSRF